MICDFAQYYHIYDYKAEAPSYVALLFFGLGENSRCWRALNGVKVPLDLQLQAMAVDCLSLLVWQNSADGQKGRNRPKLITPMLLGKGKEKQEDLETFASGKEFEKERERRLNYGNRIG